MALRDYNAAVDFVDRNVAEGRGDKTAFIDPVPQSDVRRNCAMRPRASVQCWRAWASSRKTASRWFCSILSISRSVLGSDPGRHCSGSRQHAADGRPISLPFRGFASQGSFCFNRTAACHSGGGGRPAEPQDNCRGWRWPRVGAAT